MQACRSIPKASECHSGHVCSDVATRLTPFPHPLPTSSPPLLPGSFAFLNDTKILHFVDHMQKKYITHWKHSLCKSQKLEFYVFKDSYTPSIYLDVTRKNPNRKTLVKLRISNHNLTLKQAGITRFRGVTEFVRFVASILNMRFTFYLIAQNIHQLETTFLINS